MDTLKKLLCCLLAVCLIGNGNIVAFAAEENESTESDSTGGIIVDEDASDDLVMYGNAFKKEDGTVELTPLATWSSGSVWYGRQIDANSGFTARVEYWAGGGRDDSYGGADGIVMTFAEETGLGSDGEYMGFVTGSYGVELDSYPKNSGDPSGKHIAIIYDKVSNHLAYSLDDRVDDSQWHTLEVTYTPGTLTVFLDEEQVLTQEDVTLPNEIYLGISAATGSGKNQHLIRNFFMKGVVSTGSSFDDENIPIIVIPGIMGSKLYGDDGVVWGTAGAVMNVFSQNGAQMSIDNELYTTGLVEETRDPDMVDSREYGTLDWYKNLVDFLCDQYPYRDVYFYSYDWRQSNAVSASDLAVYLDSYGIEKADFICHSMGGLVISQYINNDNNHAVNHVITLGTPYEGATRLLEAVLTTTVVDGTMGLAANPALILGGLTYDIKRELLGVGELSPTVGYWDSTKNTALRVETDEANVFEAAAPAFCNIPQIGLPGLRFWLTVTSSAQDEKELKQNISKWLTTLEKNYRSSGKSLYDVEVVVTSSQVKITPVYKTSTSYNSILSVIFEDNLGHIQAAQENVQSAIKTLLEMDNAYFAIGHNKKTMTGATLVLDTNGDVYFNDSAYGNGDGTVPYDSAKMLQKNTDSHFRFFNLNHSGVAGGEVDADNAEWGKVKNWIVSILADNVSSGTSTIDESAYTVIRIACPVNVTISADGESLCSNEDSYSDSTSFGVMDILGKDNEIKMFCIDTRTDYEILLEGTGEGTMDCTIRYFTAEGELYDERTFDDVPVTDASIMVTGVDPDADSVLEVDQDGDGVTDEVWTASNNEWVTTNDDQRIPLEAISLVVENATLEVGQTAMPDVVSYPDNATDMIGTQFSSSDTAVATVDELGVITAVAPGSATITVVATNGMKAAADITVIEHMHSYTEEVTDPTCTEQGYTTYTCACGDSYVDAYVNAIGHTFSEWTASKVATCTENGKESRSCACGETETREINALGHTVADAVKENEVAASCSTDGSYESVVYCTTCGEELSRETVTVPATGDHNYGAELERMEATCTEDGYVIMACGCGATEKTVLAAIGHSFGEWTVTKAATCTENGEESRFCSCGETETREIDALGHIYEDGICSYCGEADPEHETPTEPSEPDEPGWGSIWDWIFSGWWDHEKCEHTYSSVITAPTCMDKGYTTYTCSECGHSYKDSYTDALGHAWDDGEVTKETACTENGEKTYTCDTCGETKTEITKATGHEYVDGSCKHCGEQENTKPGWGSIWDWIFCGWWK